MTITITIGLWVIPALLTLLATIVSIYNAVYIYERKEPIASFVALAFVCSFFIWTAYFTILYFLR